MITTILLYGLVLYVLIGLVTGVLFVIFGLARVLGPDTSVTTGARVLLLPGATALWPCVLIRWFKPYGAR
jgi:hypothetical protein